MPRKPLNNLIVLPIEKGIPIPEVDAMPKWRREAKYRIPLRMLEVNDSVFIPDAKHPPLREMHFLKKKFGRSYVYRTQRTEEGVAFGVRVWRVEPSPNQLIDPEAKKRDEMEKIKQNKKENEEQESHKRKHPISVRKVKNTEKEITLKARGLEKEPDWMKPKKRNCLWCGLPFESNSAGDRYHPNCRSSARNAG